MSATSPRAPVGKYELGSSNRFRPACMRVETPRFQPRLGRRWPDEAALLQPLGVERHAEPVMPKNLNQVTSGASEDVKIAGMRIAPQSLLNLKGQAVHAAPHIRSSDRKPDPHTRGNRDHRRSSTSSTR